MPKIYLKGHGNTVPLKDRYSIFGKVPEYPNGWQKQTTKTKIKLNRKNKQKSDIPRNGYCCKCRNHKKSSNHHIIPRSFGGMDVKDNLIELCSKCHDEIELKTEEWLKNGLPLDKDLLRAMILNDGF